MSWQPPQPSLIKRSLIKQLLPFLPNIYKSFIKPTDSASSYDYSTPTSHNNTNPTTMTTPQHTCLTCHQLGDKHCKDCKTAFYCSQACQKADWPFHKPACRFKQAHPASSEPQSIPCVKIHSPHTRYENITVPSTHPIFTSRALPITVKFGYPLVMARLVENLPRGRQTDNQHATWL